MKKKALNKQVKRIEKMIEKWFTILGFKWWHKITFEYEDKRRPFRRKQGREVVMMCQSDWPRQWAVIRINTPLVALMSDTDVENALVHEFAHLLLAPISGASKKDLEEFTVTRLAQILDWVYNWRKYGPKKS